MAARCGGRHTHRQRAQQRRSPKAVSRRRHFGARLLQLIRALVLLILLHLLEPALGLALLALADVAGDLTSHSSTVCAYPAPRAPRVCSFFSSTDFQPHRGHGGRANP
eukprot:561470-Prymnesium_polylepis.1